MVLAASSTVPKPPGSLGDAGREVWGRLWVAGQAWLSVETDRDVLTRLCEAHDERDAMREQIALDGFMVPGFSWPVASASVVDSFAGVGDADDSLGVGLRFHPKCACTTRSRAEVARVSQLNELMAKRATGRLCVSRVAGCRRGG